MQRIASKTDTLPASMRPFDESDFNRIYENLRSAGIPVDDLSAMNDLRVLANEAMTRGEAANVIVESWEDLQWRAVDELQAFIGKLTGTAAKLSENDPERQRIVKQIETIRDFRRGISSIAQDQVRALFFPDLQQEENQKAPLPALYTSWEPANRRFAFFMLSAWVNYWPQGEQKDLFRGWLSELK